MPRTQIVPWSSVAAVCRTAARVATVASLVSLPLRSQQPAASASAAPGVPTIHLTTTPLRLDGALIEPAWSAADSISEFTQRDPAEGTPSSERTVVRFVGTREGLWIGAWMYDATPRGIRRAQLRRDADLETDDTFTLMLSPLADKRTAFLFRVNPNGALQDAEILSFEQESREWDGIWDVRARVTTEGWQAEIFIPWQTLRYDRSVDRWDVNLNRFIRRKNESSLWRAWRRTEGIRFLERAGQVQGFAAASSIGDLPPRAIVEMRPYAALTSRLTERRYAPGSAVTTTSGSALLGDAGLDAKFAPAPTLTLDITANADFAQAEVDRQIVNLTRFPLFFPEQRPFFTEGSGIFEFGRREQTLLFYSRRIGLGLDRRPVPLYAGARLTGRLGGQQVGFLATRTGGDAPATDYVARVKRDVLGRGYVGAMLTHQDVGGALEAGTSRGGTSGGVDFNFPWIIKDQNLVLVGNVAVDGGDSPGDPTFARLMIDYPNDNADIVARFDRVGAGFDPALGFVQQGGITRYSGQANLTPRPQALGPLGGPLRALGVRRLSLNLLQWNYVQSLPGSGRRGVNNASFEVRPLGAEFENGAEFELNLQRYIDAPDEDFELFPGKDVAARRYDWARVELSYETSPARALAGDMNLSRGDFYDGESTELELSMSLRLQPHVLIQGDFERVSARFPAQPGDPSGGPRFTANTVRTRMDVAASARLSGTLFAQWENESERLSVNARLRWTTSPGSDLYVVWNSGWPTDLEGRWSAVPWRRPASGALVVKYVRYVRR
ncbi:MAG: carbohydrate binding family 9 domain-containing protein [Gemmatimonadetes bacterium]|nr:carbohydrate binding family 9 domain-containing protein [Gemmatimonadota bacterium]